ncbi:hypothetical protein [Xanthomonas citri]|nr:hypothetical protein [Xanthomonas citri]
MRRSCRNTLCRRVAARRDRSIDRHNAAMWARLERLQEQGIDPADLLIEFAA